MASREGRDARDVYLTCARQAIARAITLQDREPFSPTYGCFDRVYWGWKFTDFAGARFQEGVYTLAFLHRNAFEGNPLASQPAAADWIAAGFRFWERLQYRDGSFDEAYPFEHSLAATAFTAFYLGEAFETMRGALPETHTRSIVRAFARAGDWLVANDERHGMLSNHLAAAVAALEVIAEITGEQKYRKRAAFFLDRIYARQSTEGWYEEYGGADPGYQTHGTFYLARVWQRTRNEALLESLRRSVAFLKHFVHPNGTIGGEYGSRNTEFYFPAGFEILARTLPDAAAIAARMRPSVASARVAGLSGIDSYNFFPVLNNYLFAAAAAPAERVDFEALPCDTTGGGDWEFPDAGLVVKSTSKYFAILGLSKGGVVKVYDRNSATLAVNSCGYWATLADGRVASSQTLRRPYTATRVSPGDWVLEAPFARVNHRVQSPWLFMAFRLFTLTFGRVAALAYWVKRQLVKRLVLRREHVGLSLSRRVSMNHATVAIEDSISCEPGLIIDKLEGQGKFATIHMGSSRYFEPQELEAVEPARSAGGSRPPFGHSLRVSMSWPRSEAAK